MLNPILSLIVYLAEMLISYTFFSNVAERRFNIRKCIVIGLLVFGAGSAFNLIWGNNTAVNTMTTIVINGCFAFMCFRLRASLVIFYSFILLVISAALEFITISSISALFGSKFQDYNTNSALLVLEGSISKSFYFCTVFILSRMSHTKKVTGTLPFSLFLYPLSVIICFLIFWNICTMLETSYRAQNLVAVASIVLLLSTVLLFVTYQHQVEKDRYIMRMQSELAHLETERTYYNILEQQNEDLMAYAHDAKNHLQAIRGLSNDPQINNYISTLSKRLSDYSRNSHSGNKMLDVMIHKFSVESELRGIKFEYDIKLCNLKQVDYIDLVALLGNLLDNALEAAESSKEKTVSLATAKRNNYSVLVISNSCDVPPKTYGTHLVTSKANPKHHGYGLKNVEKTLRKYGGDFEWEYDSSHNSFIVTAMLGKPNCPQVHRT